jgi:hypothetical protein
MLPCFGFDLNSLFSAGAIWSSQMPSKLEQHLPFSDRAEREALFASITEVASKPRGHPVREGVISGMYSVLPLFPLSYVISQLTATS